MRVVLEPDLAALRKLAESFSKDRGERATTGHLLAAIADGPGVAADLLRDRRLDRDVLLKAARVVEGDTPDAVSKAIQRAREFAARSKEREPNALHVLFALCQERGTSAHRAIEQCGADVGKLRTAAMQVAMGLAAPRRTTSHPKRPAEPRPTSPLATMPKASPRPSSPPRPSPAPRTPPPSRPEAPTRTPSLPRAPVGRGHVSVTPSVPPSSPSRGFGASEEPPTRTRRVRTHVAGPASRFALDPKKYPVLSKLGRNLTLAAAEGELDEVKGRDEEIERMLDVLAKRQANNVCLLGAAGVGKTSVVRGLALRIARESDPGPLDDRIIVEIETPTLLAGTAVRGALAERIAQIKTEVVRGGRSVVVFFDELHLLFGSDAGDEAASELKLAFAKGELPCIGAMGTDDFKRTILADAGLARRFSAIEVDELEEDVALLAIQTVAPKFEAHHDATYPDETLAASVRWSVRYLSEKSLPEKALSILDLAGARAHRRGEKSVSVEHVADVVSDLAGVPKERLLETDGDRLLHLEELLAKRIVGHSSALARISVVLRRNASGFRSRRPIGSFLLLGPTGVGKTETAKAIAECLFHSPYAMTRLDLSEYAEAHAIARLIGSPPGYVGHEAGGQLTEAVRRRPYQVVLLDEIEKAHRDVLQAFLQVFDEGRLTDGRGRTVDFTNTVILLTSNLGSDVSVPSGAKGRIGFGAVRGATEREVAAYSQKVVASARAALPPELYNRLDEVLSFAPLTRDDVSEVARRMLAILGTELEAARGIHLDFGDGAIRALLDHGGFDPELGARPMRRAIGRLVEAPIAEMILQGEVRRGDTLLVDVASEPSETSAFQFDVVRGDGRAIAS
ncbi:MAG: ATP-dependent Clp protease ATP-binding subunit [Polyangiaceae bacterium]